MEENQETQWISVNDLLPAVIDGWSHSNQVLVHYASFAGMVENYGIAYYHYNPPFKKPGFTDFANPNRIPTHWMAIPALPTPADATGPQNHEPLD